MIVTKLKSLRTGRPGLWLFILMLPLGIYAQGIATTTVQGTVYLANGQPGSGSLQVSWPAFTTADNQAVAAGRTTVTIGADGFVTVKLAPNQGASPAGLYYTAVYHLSDGTTSTEYWVVPSGTQAGIAQVRSQVMPAAQAIQAVNKSYVDQSVQQLTQSLLTASGGNLSGPLYLNGDPAQPTQAATKRYVDSTFTKALPLTGGAVSGALTGRQLGAAYQVDQFSGADFGAKLQACLNGLNSTYGGTCDARNFTGTLAMSSNVIISTANATVQLPCATISSAFQMVVTAGTRNVAFHGCSLRGASSASGSQGGTVVLYAGAASAVQVGDPSYAADTLGFHMDNVVINTTSSQTATTQAIAVFRTQEMDLAGLYLLGNANQTGMTLDGTGNYSGGTFQDLEFNGFQTAVNGIGHQVANAATTDWVNASTFLRLHIDCPLSGGSPVSGSSGVNLIQGDGNTFTGGDIEGCATALHLGANAQNNTIVGLRNENSVNQVVADAGSAYNNWITGGTMFTGQLVDNGTRNSFLDTFHRSFNSLNGDWYGSQQDATVTNHFRLGIGIGNERGYLNRYQSDYGYRWTTGLSDATTGAQFYQVLDELNNVYRLSIGQYNHGQASSNNQTVLNAAGTGAVVLNGSANAGTGGVVFGAGGSSGATVATINNAGSAQFNGSLQVGGPSTFVSSTTIKNGSDAEVDAFLWAGATANQKESLIYKDYTGASQWYMVKDANNNWALNSALGGLDSFKAYQSSNSGDTYINANNPTGHIRLNYETGAGAETDIYSGSSAGLVAAFLGTTSIKLPGLAAGSGKNCLQIDNSGYLSNTGTGCGNGAGTINAGSAGQVAVYAANGTTVAGMSAVPVTAGGTGGASAATALANLGAHPLMPGVTGDGSAGMSVAGAVSAASLSGAGTGLTGTASGLTAGHSQNLPSDLAAQSAASPQAGSFSSLTATKPIVAPNIFDVTQFGAKADYNQVAQTGTDNTAAINAALTALAVAGGGTLYFPKGNYLYSNIAVTASNVEMYGPGATLWSNLSKTQNTVAFLINAANNVYVHDLVFNFTVPLNTSNANDFANRSSGGDTLRILGPSFNSPAQDVWVRNVTVYNSRNTAISVNYSMRVHADHNTVVHTLGNGIAFFNNTERVEATGNHIEDTGDDMICVGTTNGLQTAVATITGNTVKQGFAKGIGAFGADRVTITGNSVDDTWAAGIDLIPQAAFGTGPNSNITVTGNVVNRAGQYFGPNLYKTAASTGGSASIRIVSQDTAILVNGNIVENGVQDGIAVTGGAQGKILGNFVFNHPGGMGIDVGSLTDATYSTFTDFTVQSNHVQNVYGSGISVGGGKGIKVSGNYIRSFGVSNAGQTVGIQWENLDSASIDNNFVVNDHGGTYPFRELNPATDVRFEQNSNYWTTGSDNAVTQYSPTLAMQFSALNAQPTSGGSLGLLLDRGDSVGSGLAFYSMGGSVQDVAASPGTGSLLVVTSGWTALSGTVTFTETSGPTLTAGQLITPNALGCSIISGASPLNGQKFQVLSGATSGSFQIATSLVTGSGSGTCNFTTVTPAIRFDIEGGGGLIPGYLRLAPLFTDSSGPTHPIEFGTGSYYADQSGNFTINSVKTLGCTGYLKSDGTCVTQPALADPGSNGVLKRTALNTTAAATYGDIAALWASGLCGTGYLKGDGTCAAASAGLSDPGSNGVVKRTALNTTAPAAYTDITGLWASGSCGTGYLRGDGTCNPGTITSPMNVQLGNSAAIGPSAATTYYVGVNGAASSGSTTVPVWVAPRSGTISFVNLGINVTGTLDTGANRLTLKIYDITTSTAFADTAVTVTAQSRISNVTAATSDSVAAGDKLVIQVVTPSSWTTSPAGVSWNANILVN